MKITLENPIKREGSDDIRIVTLRKPLAGELRGVDLVDVARMNVNVMIKLLPRITVPTLDPAEIAALDAGDFMKLGAALSSFFGLKEDREEMQAQLDR